jgi:hypothetical protein
MHPLIDSFCESRMRSSAVRAGLRVRTPRKTDAVLPALLAVVVISLRERAQH